jgi:hypothetical protein
MRKIHEPLVVLIVLLAFISNTTNAQAFFNDYNKYLLSKQEKVNDTTRKYIKASVDRLQITLDRFETAEGHPFFSTDTVFIIDFFGMETGFPSQIIWNGVESCYYRYTFSMAHWKVIHKKLFTEIDASKRIDHFKPFFKKWVMNFDTLCFSKYAHEHIVFDGSAISFTRAVKMANHWMFSSSNSYTAEIYKDSE